MKNKILQKLRKILKYLKPEYKERCPECIKKFRTVMMIKMGISIITNKPVWRCPNCNSTFRDETKKYGKTDLKKI